MPSGIPRTTRTLIIDNYDSYTYNLYQLLAEVNGEPPLVVRNDEKSINGIQDLVRSWAIDNIVISPGPGSPACPKDIGVCREVYKHFKHIPILGVCLGHQLLANVHGSRVVRAPEPVHGRLSNIVHDSHPLFEGIPSGEESGFHVVRYHSLVVDQDSLPPHVTPIAWTAGHHHGLRSVSSSVPSTKSKSALEPEDSVLMAIAVTHLPHFGVQFHPESVGTAFGIRLLTNFRDITCKIQCRQTFPTIRHAIGPPGHNMPPKSFVVDEMGWEGNLEVCYRKCKAVLSGASGEMDKLFDGMFGRSQKAIDAFWLDSATTDRGRFSFMGGVGGSLWQNLTYKLYGDHQVLDSDQSEGELSIRDSKGRVSLWKGNLWEYLNRIVKCNRIQVTTQMLDELPFNFWGGYIGYFGYELKALCGGKNAHKASTPDACLFLADRLIAIDHKEKDVYCLAMRRMDDDDPSETVNWIDWAVLQVSSILKREMQDTSSDTKASEACGSKQDQASKACEPANNGQERLEKGNHSTAPFMLDRPRANYLSDIQSCLDYMHAGESYEICLTNKLRRRYSTDIDPRKFYTMLRKINPAPYAAFLSFGSADLSVCCSSPERFLRGDRGAVLEAKPIKGTSARRANPTEDAAAAHALYMSEKDQAENLMIVDLLRNDLGRVCEAGSVFVKSLMEVESYATVHQLVSTVKGIRRKDVSVIAAIRAAFPGGSMTGAPKIRTMEIIDNLEGSARGVYSGSIGYIGFNDTFDLNIVIRSAVMHGREMSIGAGGAIVVQSGVDAEYDEMILKTKALVQTVKRYDNPDSQDGLMQ